MASILADGNTQASSLDFTVIAGTPTTVFLTTSDGARPEFPVTVWIQIKTSGGQYMTVGSLTRDRPAQVVDGPGTFRVLRTAAPNSVGVDRE